jgi:hypothetical protein
MMETTNVSLQSTCEREENQYGASLTKRALRPVPCAHLIAGTAFAFTMATVTLFAVRAYIEHAAAENKPEHALQSHTDLSSLTGQMFSACRFDPAKAMLASPAEECIMLVAATANALSHENFYKGLMNSLVRQVKSFVLQRARSKTYHMATAWLTGHHGLQWLAANTGMPR